ncbi:MAG: zf-HC2 domain-containing protein, partial [Rhodospirillales bacterium]|nr:zf-HC2 domain-containing protein [Rhodospirillales bacterium]
MTPTHDEEMALLVQADLDGELDAARRAELVAHIAGCAECRALHAGLAALSTRLRTSLPYHAATPALRAAVAQRLAEAAASSLPTISAPARPRPRAWRGG